MAPRREFTRLVTLLAPLQVLAAADVIALELLAEAITEYRRASAVLARSGQTYPCKTAAGATLRRARPEVSIASESWRRAASLLAAFGLTPESRTRLEVDGPPIEETKLARFNRQRTGWTGAGGQPVRRNPARFFKEPQADA